jgi:hypothetical protein
MIFRSCAPVVLADQPRFTRAFAIARDLDRQRPASVRTVLLLSPLR